MSVYFFIPNSIETTTCIAANVLTCSQAETSREETDKSSIQKDTKVDIFGTCQDEKHWIADKVVIERWQ